MLKGQAKDDQVLFTKTYHQYGSGYSVVDINVDDLRIRQPVEGRPGKYEGRIEYLTISGTVRQWKASDDSLEGPRIPEEPKASQIADLTAHMSLGLLDPSAL